MKITVDRPRCAGTGNCEALAPDAFELGDDGIVRLLRDDFDATGDEVAEAVRSCPTGALAMIEA
jgi:ferredoxin